MKGPRPPHPSQAQGGTRDGAAFAAYPPDRYAGPEGEAAAWVRPASTPPELASPSGNATHYLATGEQTGGDFGLYRWVMGPGRSGPDPHFHRSITESFYVLTGSVRLHDGRGWLDAGPGDFLHVPPGACTASATSRGSRRRC